MKCFRWIRIFARSFRMGGWSAKYKYQGVEINVILLWHHTGNTGGGPMWEKSSFFTVNLEGIGRLRNVTSVIITIRNIKGSRHSLRKLHSTIHKYIRKACCHQRNQMPNSWRICSRRILYQSLETAIHFFSSTMMVPPRSM